MYTEQLLKSLAIFLMAFGLLACGSAVKAPKGTIPTLDKISESANGGWLTFYDGSQEISGELIGFKEDSLFVLSNQKLLSFHQNNIQNARMVLYNTKADNYAIWTGVNSLFSLTNGMLLIFTLPINLIVGGAVTSGEYQRLNYMDFPAYSWTEFQKFSRFPQGLLDSIDRKELEF
ncbi:hypothetical protein [Aquiflexum sp.]|uniref:hypothetical protein n=1 Tax=Aquiflexum sp. TaxID=1872584 RepID=UPI00359434B4